MMTPPSFTYRATTIAIVDKASGELLAHEVLSGRKPPFDLVTDFFEDFEARTVAGMTKGERRSFLVFSRAEGLRPDVREVVIINKPSTAERVTMGRRGPGSIETFPTTTEWGDAAVVKKGEFPRAAGETSGLPLDDGGIDEEAIRASALAMCAVLRAAVQSGFCEESRSSLLQGMKDLMISCDTEGEPGEFWHMGQTIEETAVDLYDAAIFLWLESDARDALPDSLKSGYMERTLEDEKRLFEISQLARHVALHDLTA